MRYLVSLAIIFFSCKATKPVVIVNAANNPLQEILDSDSTLRAIARNKDELHLQIIYTRIDRDENNKPFFTDYQFHVSDDYFYPASTVKLPVSLLALEKLHKLAIPGLTKHSMMITDSSFSRQEMVYNNYMAHDGVPSIAAYIKEVFLVSDNDAFNRMYEFLGQEYINDELHKKRYTSASVLHRLNISLTEEENRTTNPVSFYDASCNLLFQQPAVRSNFHYPKKTITAGKGYYAGGKLQNTPFNFSMKNRIALTDLHQLLRSVMFPETVPIQDRFNLTAADYKFLYNCMSAFPSEIKNPAYNAEEHPDGEMKFLLFGGSKQGIKPGVRIFNKIGDAYGYLNDVAYIMDAENKVEFMLSATILCNNDGIFNDDKYDYESIGFPFMKRLGEAVYEMEKKRVKKHAPDLSAFIVDYAAADGEQ